MLYGVVGNNEDARDWQMIMAADNVLEMARTETQKMFEPYVDIVTDRDADGKIEAQYAAIKSETGDILRSLQSNNSFAGESLKNFGIKETGVPNDLEEKITSEKFDRKILETLNDYTHSLNLKTDKDGTNRLSKVAIQTATEAMAKRISYQIPPSELAKL